MSKKPAEPTPSERWNLLQRRVGLGLLLIFAAAAAAGTQGPWFHLRKGDRVVLESTYGNDYRRYDLVPLDDAEGPFAKYRVKKVERALRPSNVAILALVSLMLIGLWDLAADATMMWPLLVFALIVAATAGFVVYDILYDQAVLKDFVLGDQAQQVRTKAVGPDRTPPQLKIDWGLALFVSSALVLLIDAITLTFIARRAGKST